MADDQDSGKPPPPERPSIPPIVSASETGTSTGQQPVQPAVIQQQNLQEEERRQLIPAPVATTTTVNNAEALNNTSSNMGNSNSADNSISSTGNRVPTLAELQRQKKEKEQSQHHASSPLPKLEAQRKQKEQEILAAKNALKEAQPPEKPRQQQQQPPQPQEQKPTQENDAPQEAKQLFREEQSQVAKQQVQKKVVSQPLALAEDQEAKPVVPQQQVGVKKAEEKTVEQKRAELPNKAVDTTAIKAEAAKNLGDEKGRVQKQVAPQMSTEDQKSKPVVPQQPTQKQVAPQTSTEYHALKEAHPPEKPQQQQPPPPQPREQKQTQEKDAPQEAKQVFREEQSHQVAKQQVQKKVVSQPLTLAEDQEAKPVVPQQEVGVKKAEEVPEEKNRALIPNAENRAEPPPKVAKTLDSDDKVQKQAASQSLAEDQKTKPVVPQQQAEVKNVEQKSEEQKKAVLPNAETKAEPPPKVANTLDSDDKVQKQAASQLLAEDQKTTPVVPQQQAAVKNVKQKSEEQKKTVLPNAETKAEPPPKVAKTLDGDDKVQKLAEDQKTKPVVPQQQSEVKNVEQKSEEQIQAADQQRQKTKQLALQKAKQQAAEQLTLQRARAQAYAREQTPKVPPAAPASAKAQIVAQQPVQQRAYHEKLQHAHHQAAQQAQQRQPHQYLSYHHQQQAQISNPPYPGVNPQAKKKRKSPAYTRPARVRCNKCPACLRDDCGQCKSCKSKVKFGGPGNNKEACVLRRCTNLQERGRPGASPVIQPNPQLAGPPTAGNADSALLPPIPYQQNSRQRQQETSASGSANTAAGVTSNAIQSGVTYDQHFQQSQQMPHQYYGDAGDSNKKRRLMNVPPSSITSTASLVGGGTTTAANSVPLVPSTKKNNDKPRKKRFFYKYKYMYGQTVPKEVKDVCSGCYHKPRKDLAKLQTEPILLCDGIGCNREYHIGCCLPPLEEIPNSTNGNKHIISSSSEDDFDERKERGGILYEDDRHDDSGDGDENGDDENNWYCYDCSLYGTTYQLKEYFDKQSDKRAGYKTSKKYVEHLLRKQIKLHKEDKDRENKVGRADFTNKDGDKEKEVDMGEDEDVVRVGDNDEDVDMGDNSNNDNLDEDDASSSGRAYSFRRRNTQKQKPAKQKRSSSKKQKQKKQQKQGHPKTMVPLSEVWEMSQLHHAALKECLDESEEDGNTEDNEKRSTASSSSSKYNMSGSEVSLGPDFLVGKPVRLYEPIGNLYHDGRIIDWRKATHLSPIGFRSSIHEEHEFYGISDISESEFLVRFPAGQNYRKQALYKWVILEEHSMAIGCSLVWGQYQKKKGLSGWKPAQTWLRTSLELLPVVIDDDDYGKNNHIDQSYHVSYVNLNDDYNTLYDFTKNTQQLAKNTNSTTTTTLPPPCCALAKILGEESHAFLNLREQTVDLFSTEFHQRYLADTKRTKPVSTSATTNTTTTTGKADVSADNTLPAPTGSQQQQQISTTTVAKDSVSGNQRQREISIALGIAEAEEQERVREWYEMPLKNPAHKHALTIVDEGGLPPLLMDMSGTFDSSLQSNNNKGAVEAFEEEEDILATSGNSFDEEVIGQADPNVNDVLINRDSNMMDSTIVDVKAGKDQGGVVDYINQADPSGIDPTDPSITFPRRLYDMLRDIEMNGTNTEVVSWASHGKCFKVHDYAGFEQKIIPYYFDQTKYSSFQRQLLLYGFVRIEDGPDKGAYYHKNFTRNKSWLRGIIPKINRINSPKKGQRDHHTVMVRCQQMQSYMEEVKHLGPDYQNLQMKGTLRKFLERSGASSANLSLRDLNLSQRGVTEVDPMFANSAQFSMLLSGFGLSTFGKNVTLAQPSQTPSQLPGQPPRLPPGQPLSQPLSQLPNHPPSQPQSRLPSHSGGVAQAVMSEKISSSSPPNHDNKIEGETKKGNVKACDTTNNDANDTAPVVAETNNKKNEMVVSDTDKKKDEPSKKNDDGITTSAANKENTTMKTNNKSKNALILPRLCPLIEQGLDRLWIMKMLDDRFDGVEHSLDTAASLSCSLIDCTPTAMAALRAEKRRKPEVEASS